MNEFPIVIFDRDKDILDDLRSRLAEADLTDIIIIENDKHVISLLYNRIISILVMDFTAAESTGLELVRTIRYKFPQIPLIVFTEVDEIEAAVACMKLGTFDYLRKNIDIDRFLSVVKRAIEFSNLQKEISTLKDTIISGEIKNRKVFSPIITRSRKMFKIFQYVEAIAQTNEPILITGETGAGKELIARAIHEISEVPGKFVAVNIAGLDDTIFSDTLFGHRKGAYTGADYERQGMITQAADGTLFLDEIGDMSHMSQTKLLRLLQEGEYFHLGSDKPLKSNARIVVATNQDIDTLILKGKFRTDLYYRLKTHHIHIPPLRERLEDIPLLLNFFIKQTSENLGKKVPRIPSELLTLLSTYRFPGNIRELQAMVKDAIACHQSGTLSMQSFMDAIKNDALSPKAIEKLDTDEESSILNMMGHFPTLKEMENYLISTALKMSEGNQGIAASMLGISRQALNRRLRNKQNME
ncbi:MAG: sigma-54-dependent transcriptional regulator [Nitrospirota bacterium]